VRNYTPPPFIDRTANANTDFKPNLAGLLEVDPGKNKTLSFVPSRVFSSGVLRGCSNGSLEGVFVRAIAPAPENFTINNTVGTGTFSAVTDDNGAGRLGSGGSMILVSAIAMALLW